MQSQFNSDVKMETIANRLKNLHISSFENESISEDTALRELAKSIQNLVPQAPPDCRTDRFRKNVLQDATQGRKWALTVTASTNFRRFTYQQLLHELQNSLQQHKIHENFTSNGDQDHFRKSKFSHVNFSGQGRYIRNKKDIAKCWNCQKPNCNVKQCPYPKDPAKIKRNRIKFFEQRKGVKLDRNIRETLFEFCPVTEEDTEDDNTEPEDEDKKEELAEIQNTLAKNMENHLFNSDEEDDF